MSTARYSVVDVETTGLRAHSRLAEIAILNVDGHGRVLETYETLLNPGGHPGPTQVHGITLEECSEAPRFIDVAAEVHRRIVGTVLVGHNLRFDWRVLRAEFARCDVTFLREPTGICTAQACRRAGLPSGLKTACRALGIPGPESHRARTDAEATYRLWRELRRRRELPEHGCPLVPALGGHRLPPPAAPRPRRVAPGKDIAPKSTVEEVQ